jgi:hypothetical protein
MRLGTADRPPLASNWRLILWAATLAPALLILSWSLRQARQPPPDPVYAGRTPEEAQRLKRLLRQPPDSTEVPLRSDEVRLVGTPAAPGNRVDPSKLSAINDNTFGISATEKAAYDELLEKVRRTPLQDLERTARTDFAFAVLMLEAERFRGELLTVEGMVRRCQPIAATSTETASQEAWLFTADSGVNPYRVVFLDGPPGLPFGDDLQPPIRVRATGYFFKRYSYATADDFHTAPLLLAKTLVVLQQSVLGTQRTTPRSRSLTLLAVGILAAFLTVGVLVQFLGRRRSPRREVPPADAGDSPDFRWLDRPAD